MSDAARGLLTSPEQERALVGYVLTNGDYWQDSRHLSSETHFTLNETRMIWRSFEELDRQGRAVDMLGALDVMRAAGELPLNGPMWLAGFVAQDVAPTPTLGGVQSAVRSLQSHAQLRAISRAAQHIVQDCRERRDVAEIITSFHNRVYGTTGSSGPARGVRWLGESVREAWDQLARLDQDPTAGQLLTGIGSLDNSFRIYPGDFILLPGRPSMGKSILGDQIGFGIVESTGGVGLFVNLEQTPIALQRRRLSRVSGVSVGPYLYQLEGDVFSSTMSRVAAGLKRHLGPLFDRVGDLGVECTQIGALVAMVRRVAAEHDLRVLVIDYLQLMSGPGRDRQDQMSHISRTLRLLAMELGIAVIAMAQLNRGVESRANKRPLISDLRDSGSLEQDATGILMIYRDEYYHPQGQVGYERAFAGVAELGIGKQREGERGGVVFVGFDGACKRIFDLDERRLAYVEDAFSRVSA
jgi:replicative DNA helicase